MDLSDLSLDSKAPEDEFNLLDLGGQDVSPEEIIALEEAQKYDNPLLAGAAGAARGATLGLSDVAAAGLGFEDELEKLQRYNPASSTAGEIGGSIATAFVGPGALIAKASTLATKGLGKGLAKAAAANILEGAAYGAGQSASDFALRDPESVAENILTNVGIGALTGGLFTVGSAGAGRAAKATKDLVSKGLGSGGIKKASDDAALQFLGATASDIARLNPTRASDMSQMVRDAMTDYGKKSSAKSLNTSLEDVAKKVELIRDDAGRIIGDFDNGISDLLENEALKSAGDGNVIFNFSEQGLTPLDDALSFLEQNSRNLKTQIGLENEAAKLDNLVTEIRQKVGEGYNYRDLVDLRRNVDKLLPDKAFQNINATPEQSAYYDVLREYRSYLQGKVLDSAQKIETHFGDQFKKAGLDLDAYKAANNRYGTASQIIKLSNKGLSKEAAKSPLSAIDYMLTGFGITNPGAIAALGLKKGYEKFSRPALILAGNNAEQGAIRRLSNLFNQEENVISDKISKFISGSKTGAIGASTVAATKSVDGDYGPKMEEIEQIAQNPTVFVDKIAQETAGLQEIDPEVHQNMMNAASRAAQFLASKAPKNPTANDMFDTEEWKPSDAELSSFNRYLKAIDDPHSILDDMNANLLTPEAVEAVRVVYPATLNEMIKKLMEDISVKQMKPSFAQKMQISILMGQPIMNAQEYSFMQSLQGNAAAQGAAEDSQSATRPKKLESDLGKNTMSQSQQLIASRGQ